uniref:CSON009629 protein n=1 Tax=Culicoides sonorensis TaxID=179676 RepID=A0A336M4E5_CULSO
MTENSEKFTVLPIDEWAKLRDLYKREWPKYILPYNLLQNYISWHSKDEDYVDANVKVICLENDYSDGTFLLLEKSYLFFYTLNESLDRLEKLLDYLDPKKVYRARCVYDKDKEMFKRVCVQKFGMQIYHEHDCVMFFTSKETGVLYEPRPIPKGIQIKQLKPEIVPHIAPIYPLRNEDTASLFERLIKYNYSLGAFDENGELLAFNLQFMSGEVMALQVIGQHKRRKLGSILAERMGKLITRNGTDIFVRVAAENGPALKFSESLGMKNLGRMCHIVVGPKDENIKNKL